MCAERQIGRLYGDASRELSAGGVGATRTTRYELPAGSSGSTDMGNVSYRVPSIHPMLASAPSNVVIHHPDFAKWAGSEMGDAAALDGAKALAMTAIDYLTTPALQEECRRAFAVSVGLS